MRGLVKGILAAILFVTVACSGGEGGDDDIPFQPHQDVLTSDGKTVDLGPQDDSKIVFVDTGPADTGFPDAVPEEIVPDVPQLLCDPGTIDCEDDYTSKTCNLTGDGWSFSACEPDTACLEGACVAPVCTPNEKEGLCLSPTSYSVCNSNGTSMTAEYCPVPLKCYEGDCVDLECPPDEMICKGMTAVQECLLGDDGKYHWVETQLCLSGLCQEGQCLSLCDVNIKENSYLGCDYWAVDLDNVEGGQNQAVAVVISAPTDAPQPAIITFTKMDTNPPTEMTAQELGADSLTVNPGQLKVFKLPASGYGMEGSIKNRKTFRVRSDAPVTMHQFNPLNGSNVFTNDASLLLPSNVGGTEYLVMAWPMRTQGYTFRGFMTIVATEEGTTKVEIWPTSKTYIGVGVPNMDPDPDLPYVIEMLQGDVVNVETDGPQGADLTGTRILADKKINVFGGNECANIPTPDTNYCDHVEQQLFPLHTWGSEYVGDAFKSRDTNNNQKDTWRIMAGADGVAVTLDPPLASVPALNKGDFYEFNTGDSFKATATGPILVGHFLQGSNYPGYQGTCFTTGIGDPAFTLTPPIEQFLTEYIVLTPSTYQKDYLNITFKVGSEMDITIDGTGLMVFMGDPSVTATPVGASGWATVAIPVSDGVHTVKSVQPIGVTAYGYDCDVSYAYPGGLSLKAIQ